MNVIVKAFKEGWGGVIAKTVSLDASKVNGYFFDIESRIVRASVLLRRGMAASDVATRVGFCDQSQMHRHFVRIVGCTPGTYAGTRTRKHFVLP